MSKPERSCVYKWIERSEESFQKGDSLTDVFSRIDTYQVAVHKVYKHGGILHKSITTKVGLGSLATYEYIRFRGLNLPSANTIVQKFLVYESKSVKQKPIQNPLDF